MSSEEMKMEEGALASPIDDTDSSPGDVELPKLPSPGESLERLISNGALLLREEERTISQQDQLRGLLFKEEDCVTLATQLAVVTGECLRLFCGNRSHFSNDDSPELRISHIETNLTILWSLAVAREVVASFKTVLSYCRTPHRLPFAVGKAGHWIRQLSDRLCRCWKQLGEAVLCKSGSGISFCSVDDIFPSKSASTTDIQMMDDALKKLEKMVCKRFPQGNARLEALCAVPPSTFDPEALRWRKEEVVRDDEAMTDGFCKWGKEEIWLQATNLELSNQSNCLNTINQMMRIPPHPCILQVHGFLQTSIDNRLVTLAACDKCVSSPVPDRVAMGAILTDPEHTLLLLRGLVHVHEYLGTLENRESCRYLPSPSCKCFLKTNGTSPISVDVLTWLLSSPPTPYGEDHENDAIAVLRSLGVDDGRMSTHVAANLQKIYDVWKAGSWRGLSRESAILTLAIAAQRIITVREDANANADEWKAEGALSRGTLPPGMNDDETISMDLVCKSSHHLEFGSFATAEWLPFSSEPGSVRR